MNGIVELKKYIQQEINNGQVDVEHLINLKNQLETMFLSFSNQFINVDLSEFQNLFDEFSLNMSYKNFQDAVSLIAYLDQLNAKDIPQYQRAIRDLKDLQIQIRECSLELDRKIQIASENNKNISVLEKYFNYLGDDGLNKVLSKEELQELLMIIKNSTLDTLVKFELISTITISNYEKQQLFQNSRDVLDSDDLEIEDILEDDINDDLLNKIINIVNNLSTHFERNNIDDRDINISINERKKLYSIGTKYSKYNWSLIYNDLCNYLIPKYRNNENREEIIELFNFIISKYDNYESVKEEFDPSILDEIERTIDSNDINEKKIEEWYNMINSYASLGDKRDLSEILRSNVPYSNKQILLLKNIIDLRKELKTKYAEYKEYRQCELVDRFDSHLEEDIELIGNLQIEIVRILKEIQNVNKALINEEIDVQQVELDDLVLIDETEDNVHPIEDNNIENLVIFMNDNDEHNFVNIINEIIGQGNNQTTLRNIVNCIYNKHYNCSNYRGITKSKHNGYLHLVDGKNMKYLEKNKMYRSRKGDVRCVYREIHVSQYNREIICQKYPKFTGSLFLMTGVFYKPSDDNTYVSDTNHFLCIHENEVNSIVELFAKDFKNQQDIDRALYFIDASLKQYNDVCSIVEKKKVGGK